jgi:hypothetical protein
MVKVGSPFALMSSRPASKDGPQGSDEPESRLIHGQKLLTIFHSLFVTAPKIILIKFDVNRLRAVEINTLKRMNAYTATLD